MKNQWSTKQESKFPLFNINPKLMCHFSEKINSNTEAYTNSDNSISKNLT